MPREYLSHNIFDTFVQDSWTPLFWAAKLNYRQITQLLVEHGADLNHRIVHVSVAVDLNHGIVNVSVAVVFFFFWDMYCRYMYMYIYK